MVRRESRHRKTALRKLEQHHKARGQALMAQYNPAADGYARADAFSFSPSFVLRVTLDAPPSVNMHRRAAGGNEGRNSPSERARPTRARVEIQPRVRLRFIATIIMILCAVVACTHRGTTWLVL